MQPKSSIFVSETGMSKNGKASGAKSHCNFTLLKLQNTMLIDIDHNIYNTILWIYALESYEEDPLL